MQVLRKASRGPGYNIVIKNMRQGTRAPTDKTITSKIPKEQDNYVFSANGGKALLDNSTITKMLQKVTNARAERTWGNRTVHQPRIKVQYVLLDGPNLENPPRRRNGMGRDKRGARLP